MKQFLATKPRQSSIIIAVLVVAVVAGAFGFRDRDFKKVTLVTYQDSPNATALLSITSDKTASSGEYGVEMMGKIHDGYLELRINREQGTETRLIPMSRVWWLSFFEAK